MDIQTLSSITLSSMGLMLMILFGLIERYEPHVLLYMLVNPRKPVWATWLLGVTATLFAQRTALRAMGYRLEEERASIGTESDALRSGMSDGSPVFSPAQEQILT